METHPDVQRETFCSFVFHRIQTVPDRKLKLVDQLSCFGVHPVYWELTTASSLPCTI